MVLVITFSIKYFLCSTARGDQKQPAVCEISKEGNPQ